MMKTLTTATIAAFAMLAAPVAAMAQSTVLVMDSNRVLNESQAGESIREQLKAISEEMIAELQAEGSPLNTEFESFQAEVSALSQDALQENEEIQQKYVQLGQKAQQFRISEQIKARELVATRIQAMRPVREALETILQTVVDERGADILIEREVLIYAGDQVDITDTVIERLNAQVSTVTVERVRIERTEGEGSE